MIDIDELIKYHQEGPNLEFKREEYIGEQRGELVKDILAISNGQAKGDRYIVIGLTKKSNEEITFFPVKQPEDSAHLQQYILPKIIPELKISYIPYNFEGNSLAVLIVHDPGDQPYMSTQNIKGKDKIILKPGEMWIRKGSTQMPMSRKDLDLIYKNKFLANSLDGKIKLSFANKKDDLLIECVRNIRLPSEVNKKEIEEQITFKEELILKDPQTYTQKFVNRFSTNPTYSSMSLPELRSSLQSVKMNFSAQDNYYLFEERAFKLNFHLFNSGNKHLEKVLVEIKVPIVEGLVVIEHIFRNDYQQAISVERGKGYPMVTKKKDVFIVTEDLGEIRHLVEYSVFTKPLRVFANESLSGKTIELEGIVHAANLFNPQHFHFEMSFA